MGYLHQERVSLVLELSILKENLTNSQQLNLRVFTVNFASNPKPSKVCVSFLKNRILIWKRNTV